MFLPVIPALLSLHPMLHPTCLAFSLGFHVCAVEDPSFLRLMRGSCSRVDPSVVSVVSLFFSAVFYSPDVTPSAQSSITETINSPLLLLLLTLCPESRCVALCAHGSVRADMILSYGVSCGSASRHEEPMPRVRHS